MKRTLVCTCILAAVAGCATVEKRFTVVTDPPDAEITVISGGKEQERKLASPAKVTVRVPKDPELAADSRLEIKRDKYKTKIIGIAGIDEGQEVLVKLEKIVHYLLKVSLLSPQQSDDLKYRDQVLAASFAVQERRFEATFQNLSSKPLKILWDRASYTDYVNRQHRLMHEGIRPQDRNNTLPPQVIQPGETLKEGIIPITFVAYSPEKKAYVNKLIFPVDSDHAQALKGRTYYLFLPIDMDRQIIPYNFKFQITDAIKEP